MCESEGKRAREPESSKLKNHKKNVLQCGGVWWSALEGGGGC